ncbi:hypothetical protein [Streptomyces sp. CB01881]|uniref:hypothetical protein n=1 Tax=Streptomyces sp. CB01881 TaxID=2078691 RepID=UPI0011DF35BB|nr:hypothetical protein [Streptomyces sp. CB01881]TYC76494.1 hypothetical protein EH183_02430 [Streptomyces sp. CB01881]
MGDEAGEGARRAPMVWAFAVRESAGVLVAEAIVEVGARLHGELVVDAVDSGFVLAAGEPPATTGVVEVGAQRFERLVLVGGRQVWEPAAGVAVSPGWLAAAEGRGGVVVIVVPPGTWPAGLMSLEPQERVAAFTRSLEKARVAGRLLHGTVTIESR